MPVPDHFRAVSRRPTNLSARILLENSGRDLAAELVDLGLGGACVAVIAVIEPGSMLRLRIEAPQLWDPLVLPGRVVWTRPAATGKTRFGIRFEPDSSASLAILTELVGYNGFL